MLAHYVIIGAGSAGCVLASRLSADPSNHVVLLEAGQPDKKLKIHIPGAYGDLHRTAIDWQFWTEPQPHVDGRKLYLPRGKVLGGSSSTNAMAYVRGNPADFDEWAAQGNTGWCYQDVLPYFRKSEHNDELQNEWHGQNGPLHVAYCPKPSSLAPWFVKACVEAGIPENGDYNGEEQMGAHMLQFTIRDGVRQSSATAFLKPILSRKNLTVITGAQVSRIIVENGRATTVEYLRQGRKEVVTASGEIILSAGTFQSPQLLMLSGIGDSSLLSGHGIPITHHLPGVGQNLHDHIWSGVSGDADVPAGNSLLKPWPMAKAILQYLTFRKGPLCNSPLEANAFWSTTGSSCPDIQFHFVPLGIAPDYSTDIYDLKTYRRTDGFGILSILLKPKSRGFVGLRSKDPMAAPLIQPDFLREPEDLHRLLQGMRKAIQIGETKAMKTLCRSGLTFPLAGIDDQSLITHVKKSLETLYHPVGTCKMGKDPMAVVDERLRVYGVDGLRVADASVMPVITSGNTNAATIMIGEKAADMILMDQ